MSELTGQIFDIERSSFVDGPGIRTTVFFKGCNLRCAWCHNPESQRKETQLMFHRAKCTGCGTCRAKCPNALESCDACGTCASLCPSGARELCGKTYAVDVLFDELIKDKIFYESSGGGVTFSGGECMLQLDFLAAILKKCKENGIHTAVDTAGHVPFSSFERILPDTDLFLYDVKCFDSETHKRYTGVGNELIKENLERLLRLEKPVWVRIPIILGVNDTVEEMQKIKAFLDSCGSCARVELLPYHAMGEHKYTAIGREALAFAPPTDEKMTALNRVFEKQP